MLKDAEVDVTVDDPLSRDVDFVKLSDEVALGEVLVSSVLEFREELIEACVKVVSKSVGNADDVLSDSDSLVEVLFKLDVVFSILEKDSSVTGL